MGLTMVFMSCNLWVECFNDWKSSAKTLSLLWLFSVKITILPSPGFGYGKVMNWRSNLVKIGKLITPHMNGRNLTLMLQRPRKWLTSTCAGLARMPKVVLQPRKDLQVKQEENIIFFTPFTCNATCKVFKIKAKYSVKKKKKVNSPNEGKVEEEA